MTLFERLMAIRTGGTTERCHGIVHQGSYSVAAHSWGVAMLMHTLWPDDFERLVIYCLVHDVPEAWVGDIPATTKAYSQVIKVECDRLEAEIFDRLYLPNDADLINNEDKRKLKACDHLELYLWAKEQICAGNQHAACIVQQLDTFFEERPLNNKGAWFLEQIRRGDVAHSTYGLIKEIV